MKIASLVCMIFPLAAAQADAPSGVTVYPMPFPESGRKITEVYSADRIEVNTWKDGDGGHEWDEADSLQGV